MLKTFFKERDASGHFRGAIKMTRSKALILLCTILIVYVLLFTANAQSINPPVLAQVGKPVTFAVVSIRPFPPAADRIKNGGWGTTPNGYELQYSMDQLIMNAYFPVNDRTPRPLRNLPSWTTDWYDIQARVAPEDAATWSNHLLTRSQRNVMVQEALKQVLVDRLQFQAHREPVEVDGYALVASKGNFAPRQQTRLPNPDLSKAIDLIDGGKAVFTKTEGKSGYWTFYHASMGELRQFLLGNILKPIVDETGWTGRYDFVLMPRHFETEEHPLSDGSDRMELSILGLQLKPKKVKATVLVLDHIEKPSEN